MLSCLLFFIRTCFTTVLLRTSPGSKFSSIVTFTKPGSNEFRTVAMIETETSEFDTHEYLKSVRHMKDDAYLKCFDEYASKYNISTGKKEKKNK